MTQTARPEPLLGPVFESLPLVERTVPRLVERAAAEHAGRTYLEIEGGTLTFDDLPAVAGEIAAGLASLGVEPGDRVALLLGNRIEFIAAWLGCAWLGAIVVPFAPDLRAALLRSRLEQSGACVAVAENDAVRAVLEEALYLPELRSVVSVGAGPPTATAELDVVPWSELGRHGSRPAHGVRFDDPLMILFTSGTTGPAKGVVITHHHAYCASVPLVDNMDWTPGDVLLTPLPLFHVAAQYHVLIPALAAGAQAIIRPGFSARDFWRDIRESGATYAQIIGAMANILLLQPPDEREREHRLNAMSCFPGPLEPARFMERFGVQLNTQAWGMTEVYPNQPVREQAAKAANCVGRPSPLFELKLVDDDGVEVPWDGVTLGNAVVRPRLPSSMVREYYRNPEATVAATRDLWFYTGDRLARDSEGYLYYVGRTKDMIRRRGENVSAFELEAEAMAIEGVLQAAAYGVPSELGEEDIKLDVVLDQDAALTEEALAARLRDRVPFFMVPRFVQIRDALPVTPSGRIEKYKLVAEPLTAAAVDVSERAARR